MTENKDRLDKEFSSFERRISASKNRTWFSALPLKKKQDAFFRWKKFKWSLSKYPRLHRTSSASFKNFIRELSKNPYFRVPKHLMRDKQINTILE